MLENVFPSRRWWIPRQRLICCPGIAPALAEQNGIFWYHCGVWPRWSWRAGGVDCGLWKKRGWASELFSQQNCAVEFNHSCNLLSGVVPAELDGVDNLIARVSTWSSTYPLPFWLCLHIPFLKSGLYYTLCSMWRYVNYIGVEVKDCQWRLILYNILNHDWAFIYNWMKEPYDNLNTIPCCYYSPFLSITVFAINSVFCIIVLVFLLSSRAQWVSNDLRLFVYTSGNQTRTNHCGLLSMSRDCTTLRSDILLTSSHFWPRGGRCDQLSYRNPANTTQSLDAGPMLGQHGRRWANIKTCLVFVGIKVWSHWST